jgi:hypothetical protein
MVFILSAMLPTVTRFCSILNGENESFNERVSVFTQNFMGRAYFIEDARHMAFNILDLSGRNSMRSLATTHNLDVAAYGACVLSYHTHGENGQSNCRTKGELNM